MSNSPHVLRRVIDPRDPKEHRPLRIVRHALLTIAVVLMIGASFVVNRVELHRRDLKDDLKEISNVSYGLFNMDTWRDTVAHIIARKVQELEIRDENRAHVKVHIEGLMYELLDEVDRVVEERNRRSGLPGAMRQAMIDVFVDVDAIRSGVPGYADRVIDYLNDPEHRDQLSALLLEQFQAMARRTESTTDYLLYNSVLERHGCATHRACADRLQGRIDVLHRRALVLLWVIQAAALLLILLLFVRWPAPGRYGLFMMVAASLCLLVNGLTLPMIEIEAAIHEFSFVLAGEPVSFRDQVLFYQSKSILQVTDLLLTDGDVGLFVVGVLVLAFSVLIPFSKMIASLITVHQRRPPVRRFHRFLVFRSGKWSMADVMVVAIFMAFVGFNGIVNNQMALLEDYTDKAEVIATNRSGLQVGFYLFLAYCVLGLLLGSRIEKQIGPGEGSRDAH